MITASPSVRLITVLVTETQTDHDGVGDTVITRIRDAKHYTYTHTRMFVREYCKDDERSLWGLGNFDSLLP